MAILTEVEAYAAVKANYGWSKKKFNEYFKDHEGPFTDNDIYNLYRTEGSWGMVSDKVMYYHGMRFYGTGVEMADDDFRNPLLEDNNI